MPSNDTTTSMTWLITGAGRGMGVDFAKAALAVGHNVVATGRRTERVPDAVGEHENVLPVMREQRAGLVVAISSAAGLSGGPSASAYAASKFGLEGWMEGLAREVEPFGIRTVIVEPGFFRTELLQPESTTFAELTIDDYAEQREGTVAFWTSMNGKQVGDHGRLARALVDLADSDEPPLRWIAGDDALEAAEQKARLLLEQADAHRELSTSLAHDDARVAV